MSQIDYAALGQTEEEAELLREHDKDEDLHAFVNVGTTSQEICGECGDDPSGLMHNNTWRNVEPLLNQE